ncbi:MAG: tRNA (guanosine(37)-N1)-methyltransferase TrmD [Dehalococcoidia bacterium]|nr:tRNA (guanosine(37)-N1)-methyltransferase TrmD [Dehalococcoidia bacterium]
MKVHILTLFPAMFEGPFSESMVKRAQEKGLLQISLVNIRDYAHDKHQLTDDYAYGGGAGMVMKPEPVFEAIESITGPSLKNAGIPIVLTTPQGQRLDQPLVRTLAANAEVIIICGHYEGMDDRIREGLATHEISIGDYVLTGGELPAMVLTDAMARLQQGVLGSEQSLLQDSFNGGLLQYPQFTRPPEYKGMKVPDILVSGNHGQIDKWKRQQSLLRTARNRPNMLSKATLTKEDKVFLKAQGINPD